MWILSVPSGTHEGEVIKKIILPNKEYSVGRGRDLDISLASHPFRQSVSQIQFKLQASEIADPINNNNKIPPIKISVCGRAKTHISKEQKFSIRDGKDPKILEYNTSPIKMEFGKDQAKLKLALIWSPICIGYSANDIITDGDKTQEVEQFLESNLKGLNIEYCARITENTTCFLQSDKLSTKLALALVKNISIVNPDYVKVIKRLSETPVMAIDQNYDDQNIPSRDIPPSTTLLEYDMAKKFPKIMDYFPNEVYRPNPERLNLFRHFTFVVTDKSQFQNLEETIKAGGGKVIYYDLDAYIDANDTSNSSKFGGEKLYEYCSKVKSDSKLVLMKGLTEDDPIKLLKFKMLKRASIKLKIALHNYQEFFDVVKNSDSSILLPGQNSVSDKSIEKVHSDLKEKSDEEIAPQAPSSKRRRTARNRTNIMSMFLGGNEPVQSQAGSSSNSPVPSSYAQKLEEDNLKESPKSVMQVPDSIPQNREGAKTSDVYHTAHIHSLPNQSQFSEPVSNTQEPVAIKTEEDIIETQASLGTDVRKRRRPERKPKRTFDDLYGITQESVGVPVQKSEVESLSKVSYMATKLADTKVEESLHIEKKAEPSNPEKECIEGSDKQQEVFKAFDIVLGKDPEVPLQMTPESEGSENRSDNGKISLMEAVRKTKKSIDDKAIKEVGGDEDMKRQLSRKEIDNIRRQVKVEEFEVTRKQANEPNESEMTKSGDYSDWSTRKNFKKFIKNSKKNQQLKRNQGSVYKEYITFEVYDLAKDGKLKNKPGEDEVGTVHIVSENELSVSKAKESDEDSDDGGISKSGNHFKFSCDQVPLSTTQDLFVGDSEDDQEVMYETKNGAKYNTRRNTRGKSNSLKRRVAGDDDCEKDDGDDDDDDEEEEEEDEEEERSIARFKFSS
ncbi:hypothetical protein DASC09_012700 [Saccharomycopsis crataegensis]|uniref:Nibrin second BRCT domain-containing protein n=1 Tax=Saccharomycopsis crataegensis TaxID=43959 RepID=A0AAV5QHK4_9ASCO|nr:hypothetical protein DASC09_012700 [Saccharomycopsis crataegensis]